MCLSTIITISTIALIFSSLVGVLLKMKGGFGTNNLKIVGLTITLGFAVLLSLSEIDSKSISATYSIIGMVVGYLFNYKKTEDDL